MNLFNRTRNKTLSDNVLVLKTLREKTDGMSVFEKPRPVYFETRWGIHTFGVKFSIDVAILDMYGAIRALKKNMKPNSFFFWNPKYKRVLELPPAYEIEKDDVLELSL